MKRWLFLHRKEEAGHVNEFELRAWAAPGDESFSIETEIVGKEKKEYRREEVADVVGSFPVSEGYQLVVCFVVPRDAEGVQCVYRSGGKGV